MKKAFRKALSILLVAVMLVSSAPLTGFVGLELPDWLDFRNLFAVEAEAATYGGTCGKNLTWTLDTSTGELVISGTGAMNNYSGSGAPWYSYRSYIKTVKNGNGVTSIGSSAFYDCSSLTSIIIPDSITSISAQAFDDCDSLTSITIPDSVTSIGDYAFWYCESLTSITIGKGVTSIGDLAFFSCDSLTSITVDKNNKNYSSDASGVLFNKNKTQLIQYPIGNTRTSYEIPYSVTSIGDSVFAFCRSLTSVTIPYSVTSIGDRAFGYCDSLTSITIPDSVTSIGDYAFWYCDSLTSITIPDSVTSIGYSAFADCSSLTSITIPDSVTSIGYWAFSSCDSLTNVTIPDSVTSIGDWAFGYCTSLTSITIPDSVTSIGEGAFNDCNSLKDVYYAGKEEQWKKIAIGGNNQSLTNATIYYNFTGTPNEPDSPEHTVNIPQDIVFIDKDWHCLFSAYDKNGNEITNKVNWSATTSVNCTGEVKIGKNGDIQGIKEGLTNVHATYYELDNLDSLGSDSCYVFVGDPNEAKYTSVSDTVYYYGENTFYSDAGQFSDSVDIYVLMKNALHEQIEFLTEYDKYADELSTLDMGEFTIYASVDGANLSFYKNEYINNYIVNHRNIPISKAVDELLTLYPYNLDVSSGDKTFTVTIRIESEDFETITDSFTFKISSLEDKEINEHISFIDSNDMYEAMRDNDFATGMSDLKNDSQYIWSKYSTLDFENYHEVLMADILVKLMETQLVGHISLLPVLKEWNSNYNTILGSVSTIVEDGYAGSVEITDNLIDKVIKKSKYTTDGMEVHDEVRDLVVLKLRDKVSIDKINSAFAALDKTGQCLDLFDMGVNITNDIADWVDCVSIMNSYQNMNEEFKNVIKKVYDCIPNDDWQVKEAVNHYVKLDTTAGYTQEVIESVIELSKDITLEVFNSVFKEQFISMFTKAVGSITLKSGALLSSTTAFSTISTGLGAISTGATLGLCISDILCNNSGQAEEMGKIVAASQLAPYVIQTLKYYEWALKNYKDDSSLKHFEVAFNLNKALQIYSVEHTYKGLEIQANSIVIKLFSNKDYPGAMTELASLKESYINCDCCEDVYTGVIKTKTIAIKCPVDVYIYDENGKEVVRIINDVVEHVETGINVFINGREKYVTVPADQEYSVKIVATDEGTMDYIVIEHDGYGKQKRIVNNLGIDLTKNKIFIGNVCEEFDVNKDSYALNSESIIIKPSDSVDVSQINYTNVSIRTPSTTTIKYGDGIILHADLNEALPAGWSIKWSASNGNFDYTVSADGTTCTITPSKSGDTTFTATVYDAEGNEVCKDEQTMTSKAGFFQKLIAFFKKIFGLTKTYPEAFKGTY